MSGKIMAVENSQKQQQHETSTSSTSAGGPTAAVHYCKVCKRRFHCSSALGGHMRSHADDHGDDDDDDVEDDYVVDVKSCRTTNKAPPPHSYFLRTNTNRFVSHRGGVANKDHQDRDYNKRVTTRAEYCASREEEDLANCLVMLSSNGSFVSSEDDDIKAAKEIEIENNNNNNNKGLFQCKACKKVFNSHQALGGHRASHKKVKGCYAAKLDSNTLNISENNNLNISENNLNSSESEYLGHRQDFDYSLPSPVTGISRKRSRVHQCSICHRIFSSGQALGGHKRCHWLSASGMPPEATTLIQNFQEIAAYDHSKSPPLIFKNPAFAAANPPSPSSSSPLDLNFPPLAGDTHSLAGKSRFAQETPTRSYLKMWGNQEVISNTNTNQNNQNSRNNNIKCGDNNDEKPKMKSPKLSELKDLILDEGSTSGWLQVGIASCHALI